MISLEQVLKIHTHAIEGFGGANGVRNIEALKSAIARPFQTFDGKELYPTIFEKAAAIGESIIANHPFIDGNKRTGYILMEALLRHDGFKIVASDEELYSFIINISTGSLSFEEIVAWLKENTISQKSCVHWQAKTRILVCHTAKAKQSPASIHPIVCFTP